MDSLRVGSRIFLLSMTIALLACLVTAEVPSPLDFPPIRETTPERKRPPRPAESIAPASGVVTNGDVICVSVYIDVLFEAIKYPEGTAMLRTKDWLRKSFPALPKQFSLNGRVVENGFDEDERVYRYRTEYQLPDIKAALSKNEVAASNPASGISPESEPDRQGMQ